MINHKGFYDQPRLLGSMLDPSGHTKILLQRHQVPFCLRDTSDVNKKCIEMHKKTWKIMEVWVKYDKYDPQNPTIWEDDIQDMPKKMGSSQDKSKQKGVWHAK